MYSTHKSLNAVGEMHHHMNHDSDGEHHYDAMQFVDGDHLEIDNSMLSEPEQVSIEQFNFKKVVTDAKKLVQLFNQFGQGK